MYLDVRLHFTSTPGRSGLSQVALYLGRMHPLALVDGVAEDVRCSEWVTQQASTQQAYAQALYTFEKSGIQSPNWELNLVNTGTHQAITGACR